MVPRTIVLPGARDAVAVALLFLLPLALGALAAGCASGSGGGGDAGGGGPRDAQADGSPRDGGRSDGGDGGGRDFCEGVVCGGFEHCVSGSCRPYPACSGDGSCPEGSFCHSRRCVPGDVDIDGDGAPAGTDCDETNAMRSPDLPELCDNVDNDCNDMVDDGDAAALCESSGGGVCISGSCGCPTGSFDIDRTVAGCECMAMPALDTGTSCAAPIDLGNVADGGDTINVSGNIVPAERVVYYRFTGVDSPDSSCDAYHVRVLLTSNPSDAFELTVFQGGACDTPSCDMMGLTDFEHATDLSTGSPGALTGECPCWGAPAAPMDNIPQCQDQSTVYIVQVRRRAGSTLSCDGYSLEISNGRY